jgi:hypothetical protein
VARSRPPPAAGLHPADIVSRAVAVGDPHAIKFADAAVDAWLVAADPALLGAAHTAVALISAD